MRAAATNGGYQDQSGLSGLPPEVRLHRSASAGTVRPREMEHLKQVSKDQEEAVCREYLLANYERARHRLQERMHSLLVQLRSLSPERASSPVKRRAMKLPTAWGEMKMRHSAAAKSAEEKEVKSMAPKLVEVMRSCKVGDQAGKDQVQKLQREVQSLRAAEAAAAQKVQELQQLLDEGTLDKLRQLQSLEKEVPGLKKRLEELQAASEESEKLREEVQSLREAVAKPNPLDEVPGLRQKVQDLQAAAELSQDEVQSLRTAEAAAARKVQELQQLSAEVPGLHKRIEDLKVELEAKTEQLQQREMLQLVQPSQRQELQADNVVRRWTEQQMELLLPLAWSRWKGFWLERQRRVECAGLKEKVEVYSKEVDAGLELRWALAEEKAARRAAEKQQQQLQSEMKELLQNDLKLNTQLEQQEHSFRLEIQQLRTEVERRPFSARSRSKSTPREDLVASPQSDAVLAEDARATAATVVHDFLHFESASPVCHGYRWPGGGLSPSRPSKETSPVRKAIPVEELRKQRGRDLFQQERHGGRLKPPLPRPRIEPAAVCDKASVPEAHHNHLFRGRSPSDSAVDSRGSDANGVFANEAQWAMNRMNLHQQGRGLPLEDSIASDALTVQDDGSEGSCPGDATAVFLQSELQDALESALAQHSPSVGSAPCFSAEP